MANPSQAVLDSFWWGGTPASPGSATNILQNAYVTMRGVDVAYLKATDPVWNALLAYCYQNKLYGFGTEGRTLWDGTGSNSDRSIGPIKS